MPSRPLSTASLRLPTGAIRGGGGGGGGSQPGSGGRIGSAASARPLSRAYSRPGTHYSRLGTQHSRPGTQYSRPGSGAAPLNTGRRRRALKTIELTNEMDEFRRGEAVARQRFDLRLAELQLQLRKELGQLPSGAAAAIMAGREELLQKPDFSKAHKWEKAASFSEIFEQNPGYRPTPRDKQSPEWERLFGARV